MIQGLKIPVIFSAVDKVSQVAEKVKKATDIRNNLTQVAKGAAIAGTAVLGYLTASANEAIKFEDQLADVAKTTGLAGKDLDSYGQSILKLSETTRSSIDDIVAIGVIGGQLGIAKDQLEAFTISANKFAVALGGDYSEGVEGAISSVGKLNALFKDTQKLNPAESLNIAGSMINELTNMGVKAENINDFALRVGRLPMVLKPSLQSTLALGTTFEKLGVNSEIASSGFNNLIIRASQSLPAFAQQMKISTKQAQDLFNQDPVKFASKFAQSFKGMNAEQMALKLKDLKLNSNEVIGAVGALAAGENILAEAMQKANEQYSDANSLTGEYNTKNNTTKANLQKLQNQIKTLSIEIGSQLLPIIKDILEVISPIIKGVIAWARENPFLAKGLLILTGLLYTFAGVMGVVNAVMIANPIGLIVVAVAALVALVASAIYYYNEWGAVVLWLMGPFGRIIALITEIANNWEGIKKAFKDGGITGGIKAIGSVIGLWVLKPVEQVLTLLSKIPGVGKIAQSALNTVKSLQSDMAIEAPQPSPQTTQTKVNGSFKGNIGLNINDPLGRVGGVTSSNPLIPVSVTRTNGNR